MWQAHVICSEECEIDVASGCHPYQPSFLCFFLHVMISSPTSQRVETWLIGGNHCSCVNFMYVQENSCALRAKSHTVLVEMSWVLLPAEKQKPEPSINDGCSLHTESCKHCPHVDGWHLLTWHLSLCAGVVPKSHPQNVAHRPTALTIGIIWSTDGQNMNERKAKEEKKN